MNATETTHAPRPTVMLAAVGRFYARYQFASDETARQYISQVFPGAVEGRDYKIVLKPYQPRVRVWKGRRGPGRYVESGIEQAQCSKNLAWKESQPAA